MATSRRTFLTVLCALGIMSALSACTNYFPSSGPTVGQIKDRLHDHNPMGLKIIRLTPAIIEKIAVASGTAVAPPILPPPTAVGRIGVGDVLSISIFETPPALFSPTTGVPNLQSGAAAATATPQSSGATLTNLPPLQVAKDGTIFMPYGGRMRVEGLTPAEVEQSVQQRFKNKSLAPQVIVDVAKDVENTVIISGDIKTPGRYTLDLQPERLLDVIALAGGPLNAPYDEAVTVIRNRTAAKISLGDLTTLSPENLLLSPGDRVEVNLRPRTFTAFGAAGKVSEIDFKNPSVTLAEGLARAAAVTGVTSDATGVYLFRFERPTVARALGLPTVPGQATPVIYRADLMEPTTYALLPSFQMQNKDLVYVAEARSVQLQNFLTLVFSLATPLNAAASARLLAP